MYKTIFLGLVLIPFIGVHASSSSEVSAEQLRNDLFEKNLELSTLSKEIEAREELIELMMWKAISAMKELVKSWTDEEKNEFLKELSAFQERYNQAFTTAKIKSYLVSEMLNDEGESNDAFERIKSLLVRRLVEKDILKHLLKRYEAQLQASAELQFQLTEIEKLVGCA